MSSFEITIPTYVNPHLFWVIEKNNHEKQALMEACMKMEYKNSVPQDSNSITIGDIVAVVKEKTFYRATIECIDKQSDHEFFPKYICWLIDAGIMHGTDEVYKLPSKYKKMPPLAKQACLNNVVFVAQHLTFDANTMEGVIIDNVTKTPHSYLRPVVLDYISKSKSLQFHCENKVDGILLGDIQIDGEMTSLSKILVEKHILIFNEQLFAEVMEKFDEYREKHLILIYQICKKQGSEVRQQPPKISRKYLEEMEENDIYNNDEKRSTMAKSNRKSLKSSVTSENESISCSDTEYLRKNRPVSSETMSTVETSTDDDAGMKRKILLDRFRKKTAKKVEDNLISSETTTSSNESSVKSPKEKLFEYLRTVRKNTSASACESKSVFVDPEIVKGQQTSTDLEEPMTNSSSQVSLRDVIAFEKAKNYPTLEQNIKITPGGASHTLKVSKNVKKPETFKEKTKVFQSRKVDKKNAIKENEKSTTIGDEKNSFKENKSTAIADEKSSIKENLNSTTEETITSTESTTEESKPTDLESADNLHPVSQLQVKPHCSCKQCDHFSHEQDWRLIDFCEKSKKNLTPYKPSPLLKSSDSSEEKEVISLDYFSMSKIQKQATYKLLIHGESIPNPIRYISDANFHKDIHKSLNELDYVQSKRIQAYVWPAVMRSHHVCIVNGPKSGKSLSYLPVICTFVLEKAERYSQMSKIGGPLVVILCKNSNNCEEIYDLIMVLLGRTRVKVNIVTYPINHINTCNVDILVTMPNVLVDLLKSNAVNFKRLCHFIIEDADVILKKHEIVVTKLIGVIENMLSHRVSVKDVQLILCGEHWNLKMEQLLKKLHKMPVICIGNHLEAAFYGRVEFVLKFLNSACKELEVKNLLKDIYHIFKSVIVANETEIEDLKTFLVLKGIDAVVISDGMKQEEILFLEETWSNETPGEYSVLVCTDFMLQTLLTVSHATILIHYSLPTTWTKFVKRFGCLLSNNQSPLVASEKKVKCQSYVLTDETCMTQMPKFLSFLKKLKINLPDVLNKYYEDLKMQKENDKVVNKLSLCDNLRLFGQCQNETCSGRHLLDKDLDVSNNLPKTGKITFKIAEILDVTHFAVTLIEHVDVDGNVSVLNIRSDVTKQLTDVLSVNKKQVKKPILKHLYAYYDIDNLDVFYRCELLDSKEDFVQIKLVDEGNIVKTIESRLYKLPSEFRDIPFEVVDVYLANCVPPYQDENYSARSFFKVKNLLSQNDYKNVIFTGEIHLQLENTFWLKNVFEEIQLDDLKLCKFNLGKSVKELKLSENNDTQLKNLYELCDQANIVVAKYERISEKIVAAENQIKPQWAFLEKDLPNEVIFCAAISPNEIFVRLEKFNHLLYKLQREIQDIVKKTNYDRPLNVTIGKCFLAKDPKGDDYSRVIVLKIEDNKALCFFVDFGDEAVVEFSELKYLMNSFISKLPFQTIQCSLHGVKPVLDDWQEDVVDILYEYSTEPNTDIFRSLFIKVCSKKTSSIDRQVKYSVLLKDGFTEKQTLINSLLIDCGLAIPTEEPIENFALPVAEAVKDDSENEIEHIRDIVKKTEEIDSCVQQEDKFIVESFDGDMEVFINDPFVFFNDLRKTEDQKPTNEPTERELPAIQAAPPVDYYTPTVYWSQTNNTIRMNIKLVDVECYTVNLTKSRIFSFRTEVNEKTYLLKLMLYDKVESVFQHTSIGQQIRVTFSKIINIMWPRLILPKDRLRNIHYDLSTIKVEEKVKKKLELPKCLDDADSDTSSIDMMYHVVSDQDSDYDEDLQLSD